MRKAASILLLADDVTKQSMKVLMIKRHSKARFMANMYVFPGGTMEVSDGDAASPDLGAFRKAALRELWEETSVTLNSKGEALARSAEPDYSLEKEITPFAHWITPPSEPYRYDTWFFAHCVSNPSTATELDLLMCPREIADLRWVEPAEAIALHKRSDHTGFFVSPPTMVFLDFLRTHKTPKALLSALEVHRKAPTVTIPEVITGYKEYKDGTSAIFIPSGATHMREGRHDDFFYDNSVAWVGDAHEKDFLGKI